MGILLALAPSTGWTVGPNIALFHGADPPWNELSAFDIVVVEPDHGADPKRRNTRRSELFAYVSLGEVQPSRGYAKALPVEWRIGENTAWGSVVVDQARPEWPAFFAERVVAPLWAKGYRGLFVDTLDSYHLVAKTDAERARQEAGMVATLREVRRRFPGIRLIFNRGFEILPHLHAEVFAVAAESLFRGWDAGRRAYREVPQADRDWLLGQLNRVRDTWRLPVLAIDYVPPADRALARETARKISALGFIPWVADPDLGTLGVGAIEVMPRKVLMIHAAPLPDEYDIVFEPVHRFLTMPLNHLGYVAEYANARGPLRSGSLAGRYAGIVVWLEPGTEGLWPGYRDWLLRAVREGIPVAVFQHFAFPVRGADALGIATADLRGEPRTLRVAHRDPAMGHEIEVLPDRRSFQPMRTSGKPLLTLVSERGDRMDAAAITPWGGYVLAPYALTLLPKAQSQRWVIDPFAFLQQALRLPAMPIPDVTTENGRRLMIVHVDGDGFPSRAEMGGSPIAAQVMLKDLLERYRVPSTVSVIQGEVSPRGLFAKLAPELERIARAIFALPHVELASHSHSHPFDWRAAAQSVVRTSSGGAVAAQGAAYNLALPGYTYDPRTEVQGSIDYIDKVLAPPGKRTRVFLWTGDCNPGTEPLGLTYEAGVGNMNGGDTTITEAERSLTLIAPLGVTKGAHFQVYAPNQNENVYTGDWRGPFYGYERVIETFRLTESPRRLKPINIYYHTYSASKTASLVALHKVYRWALEQPVMNVYASEYIDRVHDFNRMVVVRDGDGFLVRGAGDLRTVRWPAALGVPSLRESTGVAGYVPHEGGDRFVHLADDGARIVPERASDTAPLPRLATANARLTRFERTANGFRMGLRGHLPVEFTLGEATRCTVQVDGRPLRGEGAARDQYRLGTHGSDAIEIACRA